MHKPQARVPWSRAIAEMRMRRDNDQGKPAKVACNDHPPERVAQKKVPKDCSPVPSNVTSLVTSIMLQGSVVQSDTTTNACHI